MQAQSWSVISKQNPHPRAAAEAVAIDDKFYLLGGLQPNTTLEENRIDVFDPFSNAWSTVVPQGSFTPGFGGMTWYYDGKIFRYNQKSVLIYYPALNLWDAPLMGGEQPTISTYLTPIVVGSKVYFVGGDPSSENFILTYLEMSDLTWGQITTTGAQSAGSMPFGWSSGTKIFVFQGIASERTSDVSILDLQTLIWSRHSTGSEPYYYQSGVEHDGKMILLAHPGVEGATLKTLSFDPADNSLKELTLERQVAHTSSPGLFNLGGVLYSVGYRIDEAGKYATDTVSVEALTLPKANVGRSVTSHQIQCYPNPASSTLQVKASAPIASIEIIDVVGRPLLGASGISFLDVSSLPSGLYQLRCKVEGEWIVSKFVKN